MRGRDSDKTWWQRNWGWCLGCGCLIPLLAIGAVVVGTGWLATQFFNSNEAVEIAMDLVNENPRAVEVLGEPIELRLWRENTTFNFSDNRLEARFGVVGPKGRGRIELEAHTVNGTGRWKLDRLLLYTDDRDGPLDLLEESGLPGELPDSV